jgi:hypothetical protein
MPTSEFGYCAGWRVGQRVVRKNSEELGIIVQVDRGTVKVKWDRGRTSYYFLASPGNVKLAEAYEHGQQQSGMDRGG